MTTLGASAAALEPAPAGLGGGTKAVGGVPAVVKGVSGGGGGLGGHFCLLSEVRAARMIWRGSQLSTHYAVPCSCVGNTGHFAPCLATAGTVLRMLMVMMRPLSQMQPWHTSRIRASEHPLHAQHSRAPRARTPLRKLVAVL